MINYSYKINSLICSQLNPEMPDLVERIHLTVTAVDDLDQISTDILSVFTFTPPSDFIPFQDLTEEVVNTWIDNNPGMTNCKKILEEMIETMRNPPYIEKIPPWIVIPESTVEPSTSTT